MKKYFFIAVIFFTPLLRRGVGGEAAAQQVPLFTHYDYNPLSYNPAFAGNGEKANAFLSHRNQWKNIPGAPQATRLSFDGPLRNKKIGLGADVYNFSAGIIRQTGINTYYSYRADVSETSHLSFGIILGVSNNMIDFSQVIVKDENDPFLMAGAQQKTLANAGAGVAYILNKTEVGVSLPGLLGNKIEYADNNNHVTYSKANPIMISAKQSFFIDKESNISAFPLVVVRLTKGAPVQYDVNAVLNWKEQAWLGIFYQSNNSAGVNGRIKVHESLSVGYSYSALTNSLGTYTGSSHELLIGYSFNIPNKKETDKIIEAQRQEIATMNTKLQAVEEAIKKSSQAEVQALKDQINALNQQIEKLKKESSDTNTELKMQIAGLKERVELLVKLINN